MPKLVSLVGLLNLISKSFFNISPPNEQTLAYELVKRLYNEKGPQALYEDTRGRRKLMNLDKPKKVDIPKYEEESLIEEVERLRMENAYLKKLNALVQEREKSVQKTK